MTENDPIIPGCPSVFPHELPSGFDGVAPDDRKSNFIFLDVDGVLNYQCEVPLNKALLENLAFAVKATNAKVVVSSSWRDFDDMMKTLEDSLESVGVRHSGITDRECAKCVSIERYLEKHGDEIGNYVVLDDDTLLAGYFDRHFVHCKVGFAFDRKTMNLVIDILKGGEAKKDDRHFRLGETSEKVKLHCAKVIEECRANTDFKGECHSVFVACYVDGRLEFAGADVTMCDKVQLDRAVARSQALNILARMNPYGDLSFAKDSADGTEH